MSNNFTNISKTNNHLWPSIIEHIKKEEKTTAYGLGNPDLDLRQTQMCGGIKPVNGIPNTIIYISQYHLNYNTQNEVFKQRDETLSWHMTKT